MNCKACNKLLNRREEKREYAKFPELVELCDLCLEGLEIEVKEDDKTL